MFLQTALASPVLALYNTQRSAALVGQLCAELDLLAASCHAMEEEARLKLVEVGILSTAHCTCRTVVYEHDFGLSCGLPSLMRLLTG